MKSNITKFQLMNALFSGGRLQIGSVVIAMVSSVEREDGSGSSFNVYGYSPAGVKVVAHIRTID